MKNLKFAVLLSMVTVLVISGCKTFVGLHQADADIKDRVIENPDSAQFYLSSPIHLQNDSSGKDISFDAKGNVVREKGQLKQQLFVRKGTKGVCVYGSFIDTLFEKDASVKRSKTVYVTATGSGGEIDVQFDPKWAPLHFKQLLHAQKHRVDDEDESWQVTSSTAYELVVDKNNRTFYGDPADSLSYKVLKGRGVYLMISPREIRHHGHSSKTAKGMPIGGSDKKKSSE